MSWLSPLAAKRMKAFNRNARARISLYALLAIFAVSLVSELVCNSEPLFLRWNGKTLFPFLRSRVTYRELGIPERGDDRVDFKRFTESEEWKSDPSAFAVWAPFRFSPHEVVRADDLAHAGTVRATVRPDARVGRCDVFPSLEFTRGEGMECRPGGTGGFVPAGATSLEALNPPPAFRKAIKDAFAGKIAEKGGRRVKGSFADGTSWTATVRNVPPGIPAAGVSFRQDKPAEEPFMLEFELDGSGDPSCRTGELWERLAPETRAAIEKAVRAAAAAAADKTAPPGGFSVPYGGSQAEVEVRFSYAVFPFRPCEGHPFGIDSSGRDVFALVLYGTRIALCFGLTLAFSGMLLGVAFGAIEGYFGGKIDIACQRATEIWSAIPFLYVMIFIGSTVGRSFGVLLACYALFNWILVSYYVRAEFLRLRSRTFVEAARCQGLPHRRIIFGHILPNALTPLVTLFPFLLMGAIGSLSVLDFLGFGLPAFTPSWGDLVSQGQQFRWAWWLVAFPSAALFTVMLLTVLVGEGLRDAFDPRQRSKLE